MRGCAAPPHPGICRVPPPPGCFVQYDKEMLTTLSTTILPFLTNHIFALWRCQFRIRHRCLNALLKTPLFPVFQIMRTRKDALEGKALPSDFRLSPTRGRSGPRAAWGGEIGGVKISDRTLNISPVTSEIQVFQASTRIDSANTLGSLGSASIEIR